MIQEIISFFNWILKSGNIDNNLHNQLFILISNINKVIKYSIVFFYL